MSNRVKENLNSLHLISSCFKATSAIGQPDRAGRQAETTIAEAPILFHPSHTLCTHKQRFACILTFRPTCPMSSMSGIRAL